MTTTGPTSSTSCARELRKVKDTLPADVAGDALLMTDLGLDSLDVVEFVAHVEEHYRVTVPDEDWQQLSTLDRIAAYVLARIATVTVVTASSSPASASSRRSATSAGDVFARILAGEHAGAGVARPRRRRVPDRRRQPRRRRR